MGDDPPSREQLLAMLESEHDVRRSLEARLAEAEREVLASREAKLRLERVERAGRVGLWDWDLATNTVRYSDEWKRLLGYGEAELGDGVEQWPSRVHPHDLGSALAHMEGVVAERGRDHVAEFRMRHKQGHYLWIRAQASVLTNERGEPPIARMTVAGASATVAA